MPLKNLFCTLVFLLISPFCFAQHLLGKVVSIEANNEALPNVLNKVSKAGAFQFSYKSDIVLQDKKVSVKAGNKTIKQILDQVFEGNFHYSERGKYIILHSGGEKLFTISGYIQDGKTGAGISNVTVYEDQILASTLTNESGYFRLPIRNKRKLKTISIIARKESYSESFVDLNAGYDQELVLPILPSSEIILNDVVVKKEKEEANWANRVFLSSKQRVQNLNIGNFIAKRPIQTSLLPGIGTHGLLGSQVVNKFSLNILGGYTAGVNGVEIGSVFNINKGDVRYVQIAGVFNTVNGNLKGCEVSGIYNYVSKNVTGTQCAGISNIVKGNARAVQVAGISNIVLGDVKGVQIAGISNQNNKQTEGIQIAGVFNKNSKRTKGIQLAGLTNWQSARMTGLQLSGVANYCRKDLKGIQLSGVFNYSRKIKGLQIGLINVADTIDGFGIGLINYYRHGLHQLMLSSNEIQQFNLSYLSGTKRIYSILSAGASTGNNKSYSIAYGMGKEFDLNRKLAINTEIIGQVFYIGNKEYIPLAARGQAYLSYRLFKPFAIFAGPSYTITETRNTVTSPGYMFWLHAEHLNYKKVNDRITGWLGWQIGIRIF